MHFIKCCNDSLGIVFKKGIPLHFTCFIYAVQIEHLSSVACYRLDNATLTKRIVTIAESF